MTSTLPLTPFKPGFPDAAGVISWVHIGDLHMTQASEQNHLDFASIVAELNRAFAGSVAFAFLPGDVAEHGSAKEYELVRETLDRLTVPWCAIVGDHDVHEKTCANFLAFMAAAKHYSFQIGPVRFIALNAFDLPVPSSFCLLPDQLSWLKTQIQEVGQERQFAVLLLHCYPSDLKQGGEELRAIIESPVVRLIDMGHTHYNEVANDGRILYTATRSTGQIEEGPVGFSITNIDGGVLSWKFLPLNDLPAAMITAPADERFITDASLEGHIVSSTVRVRAKTWAEGPVRSVTAALRDKTLKLTQVPESSVWEGQMDRGDLPDGTYPLHVLVEDVQGRTAEDTIRIVLGASAYRPSMRAEVDHENALDAWPERGLLGTQLGPNKNGRKW